MQGPTPVFVILGIAIILFVSGRVRLDIVAFGVVLALILSGVLTPAQALAGFSDPLVIMIAALFLVGYSIVNTGLATAVGNALSKVAGKSLTGMTVALMLGTGLLSAFMSSTGTVAVILPVAVAMAWRMKVSPSKLLIPVAYAALVGGMLTLIATPPNLVVSQALEGATGTPFGFFSFTPLGLVMLAVTTLFMATIGTRLLPSSAPSTPGGEHGATGDPVEVVGRYGLPTRLGRLDPSLDSPLIGKNLRELRLPERFGVRVLAIDAAPAAVKTGVRPRRHLGHSKRIEANTLISPGDRVLLQGSEESLAAVARLAATELKEADVKEADVLPHNLGFAEVLLTPRSSWAGKTLAQLDFRERHAVQVLAVQRGNERITESSGEGRLAELKLRFGDTLLVHGPLGAIERLAKERLDAVVLSEAGGERLAPKAALAPYVIVVLLLMLTVMSAGWLTPVVAVLLAAGALVIGGALSMEEAYRSIQWESVVLIAGMLPLATALESTGGVALIANGMVQVFGGSSPLVLLAGTYLVTTSLGQLMSNTATAVLMAPVALSAAAELGVAPAGILMMVALATASSFGTPMSTPVNTLVVGPGQYRFMDYVKAGLPLQILMGVVGIILVPLFFPN